MILTLYYMYATVLQWWRLGALKNKLNGTLNAQNALLVASGNVLLDSKNRRCLENLLFQNDNRIGCTVVPKVTNVQPWRRVRKEKIKKIFFSANTKLESVRPISERLQIFSHTYQGAEVQFSWKQIVRSGVGTFE